MKKIPRFKRWFYFLGHIGRKRRSFNYSDLKRQTVSTRLLVKPLMEIYEFGRDSIFLEKALGLQFATTKPAGGKEKDLDPLG